MLLAKTYIYRESKWVHITKNDLQEATGSKRQISSKYMIYCE